MSHSLTLRVYYEDTDLAGIVYYANYLKFIERGRSEWLRELGIDQADLKAQQGQVFAVRHLEADYLRPARFDELIEIRSDLHQMRPARLILSQQVLRGADLLFDARVTIVCLGGDGRPRPLPAALLRAFQPRG